jgi:hypothetical protein
MITQGPWAYMKGHGLLVTVREDGSVPLNSKIVAAIQDVSEDNARLIEAAPKLLTALIAAETALLLAHPDHRKVGWPVGNALAHIQAAIAKVREGEKW